MVKFDLSYLKEAILGENLPLETWNEECSNNDADCSIRVVNKVEDEGRNNNLRTAHDENHAKELRAVGCDESKG